MKSVMELALLRHEKELSVRQEANKRDLDHFRNNLDDLNAKALV